MYKMTPQTSQRCGRALVRTLVLLLFIFSAAGSARPQGDAGRVVVKLPEPQLVVNVGARGAIKLDGRPEGSLRDTAPLAAALKAVFGRRAHSAGSATDVDRTVYIKAPGTLLYGDVVKVIDAAKSAGASPIKLMVVDEENHAALVGLPQRPQPHGDGDHEPAQPTPARDTATVNENSVIVSITSGGETYLNKSLIGEGELELALAALMKGLAEGDRIVYVRADVAASYGRVVRVVNSAVSAGATAVGFVGNRKKRE